MSGCMEPFHVFLHLPQLRQYFPVKPQKCFVDYKSPPPDVSHLHDGEQIVTKIFSLMGEMIL